MVIRIVRLGSPREAGEGIRLGTVRRPPRGKAWGQILNIHKLPSSYRSTLELEVGSQA